MAQLLVRNLDSSIVKKLKKQAAAHGHSAEEEHRRILNEALNQELLWEDAMDHLCYGSAEVDFEIPSRSKQLPRSVEL